MYNFSKRSENNLITCDPDLQIVCHRAIEVIDFSVLCGHRNKTDQRIAYNNKTSKLDWPDSYHNKMPSKAIDLAPYPIDWNNLIRFGELAGVILTIANDLDLKITWGGHWKNFKDYPHFQLKK